MTYLIGFGLFHLLIAAFAILGGIAIVGGLQDRRRREKHSARSDEVREKLRRRFALGEIPAEEYREKATILDQK
jgi:uncharacterized membrane protein